LAVTGARGQLGRALARAAARTGHECAGADLPELDVTVRDAVLAWVARERPDVIVNAAAFTAVDAAEERESEALAVNGTAVGHLAEAADAAGALLVQVSTDYVFDGECERPYREDDPVNPLSAYGRTKLAGERAAACARRYLIARTAWLFGEGSNFVGAILRQLAAGREELRVVADQQGCPTYAEDLAGALLALAAGGARGTVHVVNDGSASWYELAREIVHLRGAAARVVPVETAEYPRPARRPRRGVLDAARLRALAGAPLPPWQDALARYLASPWAPAA
jgi:dTDP-4-dehydrorhamnose reductase